MTRKSIFNLGVALGLLFSSSTLAFAKGDKEFLTDALKGDNSEIALGKLAAEKGGSEVVRGFGQTLSTDHAKAKEDALPVAAALGVQPTDDLMDEAKAEMGKLAKLSGAAFDKEFARYMVKDHRKDISEFRQQAKTGEARVSALAKATLPTLRKHLKIAQSIAKSS